MHSDLVIQPAGGQLAVGRIKPEGYRFLSLFMPKKTVPGHSLMALIDGTAIYLDTTTGSLIHFEPLAGRIHSSTKITEGFL
jgi:hypothetical protein